jgi:hypothetical protein
LAFTTVGTSGQALLSNGASAPTWGTPATATNLAGGSNGTIPYQSASGTTQMLAVGSSGQLLQSNGAAAPTWVTASSNFVFLSTVNATSGTTVTISITGGYSSYLLTGYKISSDTAPTTTDLQTSSMDPEGWYNNSGTWAQTSNVLNNIGSGTSSSSFSVIFNGLSDTSSNVLKVGSGTGYAYYSGPHLITLNKFGSTAISSIVFSLSGGANFSTGVFKLYGIT